jgi:hypothetical protein
MLAVLLSIVYTGRVKGRLKTKVTETLDCTCPELAENGRKEKKGRTSGGEKGSNQ